jgi:hypothetical protein
MSTNPQNQWEALVDSFEIGGWDPDFFTDDDGRLYMYNGSSNRFPLYGSRVEPQNVATHVGTRKEMYLLEPVAIWMAAFWRTHGQHFFRSLYGRRTCDKTQRKILPAIWRTRHRIQWLFGWGSCGDLTLGPFHSTIRPIEYEARWLCPRGWSWKHVSG